jgi:hypothetical protein
MFTRAHTVAFTLAMSLNLPGASAEVPRFNGRNETAIREVQAGKRDLANASWWGFDKNDSTQILQAGLNSGAKKLVIPFLGAPWIVEPLQLAGGQEILIEPGVLILAKKGSYLGGGDSLLTASGKSNIVIRGYGATLCMRKRDYQNPPYQPAEWRMGIALRGCRHVLIEGLRVESSGGDGFYIDSGPGLDWSEDVTLRNCAAFDHHRQGLSVISALNLLVENCAFSNTWGTAPEAGIDFEPDNEKQRLVNCVVRNCSFENNNGNQIAIHLRALSSNSAPVSIRFEHCLARMTDLRFVSNAPALKTDLAGWGGIAVGAVRDNGPKGLIEFVDCVTENSGKESVRIYDKSAANARLRFVRCSFRNAWTAHHPEDGSPRSPINIYVRRSQESKTLGGIDFEDCYLYNTVDCPTLRFESDGNDCGLQDMHGNFVVSAPGRPRLRLGPKLENVDLTLTPALK